MKITLTSEIENALNKHAHKKGTTPERLALDTLRERFISSSENETPLKDGETLVDYLLEHIGVLSSGEHVPGGATMSEQCGQKFAANLLKKRQRGRG